MINLKSEKEIILMRKAGQIARGALLYAGASIAEGITTLELSKMISDYITQKGATPTFLGYNGYPAAACISLNDEVIHGIPSKRKLQNGDLVKIDVGATFEGYVGDTADTFFVGKVSEDAKRLVDITRQSFYEGIKVAYPSMRVSDISNAIGSFVEDNGLSVVRDFVGHGVGSKLHESPEVPNFGPKGRGPRLEVGMTLAIEPMVCLGDYKVQVLEDGWTVKTKDGKNSAHFEHTVLITENGAEILTLEEA